MKCPECGGGVDVKDSRHLAATNEIRRRRYCSACGHRFTTYESIAGSTDEMLSSIEKLGAAIARDRFFMTHFVDPARAIETNRETTDA
jgi:transcriptional regulator NrdR family protein